LETRPIYYARVKWRYPRKKSDLTEFYTQITPSGQYGIDLEDFVLRLDDEIYIYEDGTFKIYQPEKAEA